MTKAKKQAKKPVKKAAMKDLKAKGERVRGGIAWGGPTRTGGTSGGP